MLAPLRSRLPGSDPCSGLSLLPPGKGGTARGGRSGRHIRRVRPGYGPYAGAYTVRTAAWLLLPAIGPSGAGRQSGSGVSPSPAGPSYFGRGRCRTSYDTFVPTAWRLCLFGSHVLGPTARLALWSTSPLGLISSPSLLGACRSSRVAARTGRTRTIPLRFSDCMFPNWRLALLKTSLRLH